MRWEIRWKKSYHLISLLLFIVNGYYSTGTYIGLRWWDGRLWDEMGRDCETDMMIIILSSHLIISYLSHNLPSHHLISSLLYRWRNGNFCNHIKLDEMIRWHDMVDICLKFSIYHIPLTISSLYLSLTINHLISSHLKLDHIFGWRSLNLFLGLSKRWWHGRWDGKWWLMINLFLIWSSHFTIFNNLISPSTISSHISSQ